MIPVNGLKTYTYSLMLKKMCTLMHNQNSQLYTIAKFLYKTEITKNVIASILDNLSERVKSNAGPPF